MRLLARFLSVLTAAASLVTSADAGVAANALLAPTLAASAGDLGVIVAISANTTTDLSSLAFDLTSM